MTSMPLKEFLLQKLVTFVKHLKLLKLSVIQCIHRHVLTLLRRLLHKMSHESDSHLPGQRLRVDRILGAIQPTVGDTQNHSQTPVTTLAVRSPESGYATPFQQFVGSPLAFPSVQVSMPRPYPVQTSSAVPNVRQSAAIRLEPIIASQIARYHRNITQSKGFRVLEVGPGLDNFTEPSTNIANWLQLTHPEGARFFFNPLQRVFTDQNILKDGLALEILAAAEQANKMAAEAGMVCATMELAVEKLPNDNFGYYFVDHDARVIFWPEPVQSRELMHHVRGVVEKSHVGYALEAQYWKHCTLFPNMRALPEQVVDHFRDIITYAHAESITSQTSLSPFDLDELTNMLSVVDHVKDNVNKVNEHSVCIVARYMNMFVRAKFVNFCGQLGARLDADQSLYDSNIEKSKPILFRVLNVALFNSPTIHSESIHNVWVDNTVVQPRWKKFITQLNSEWSSFTVFSTVMLAVDVSFLAIPGVDDPSIQSKPATTIVIYLSTLCAMGSLVISLVLAGQVSDNRRSSAGSVATFMDSMSQSLLGIESLAFMLSLPFALLIWGMIFFAIGLSILIFYTTDIVALTVVVPIWAVVLLLTTWPVLAANNLHVSVIAVRAAKYWKSMMKHMVVIRRQ
ncbi:hypothetical protein DEU56DRAFT_800456 [Suillus clintonianus]|uniref:uncharacterized protein n=1 Tax=Suillus clintonianus TaxID=1904413 RepID=UPI001B8618BE|nr:uncharacterized protein DEU56DRAFT_800456 [Suillus clintonianus]KAG2139269.1 hypothetical protein DEU56DRAFT_800456 [Suillus clintonianus]